MRPILAAAILTLCGLAHPFARGAEPDMITLEQALVGSALAAELNGFTNAMAAGVEEAMWHLEGNGSALHPSLGARLLTTPQSIHELRLADGSLRAQLEAGYESSIAVNSLTGTPPNSQYASMRLRGADRSPSPQLQRKPHEIDYATTLLLHRGFPQSERKMVRSISTSCNSAPG